MKWQGRERSTNIEDRRGQSRGGIFGRSSGANPFGGNSGSRIPIPIPGGTAGGVGGIGIIIAIVVIGLILGVNPLSMLGGDVTSPSTIGSSSSQERPAQNAPTDELGAFVGVVVKETENLWTQVFAASGATYEPPVVVLFNGQTQSACGLADASMGPFYCPNDQKVYLDLTFYDALRQRFGAPGDFAQAYVLAHEVGHHVQELTGVLPRFAQLRQSMSEVESNQYSVRVELQADCYAGIWANYAGQQNLLESGDIQEAVNAANQIGDDTLQRQMQGYAVPKTFNHGTSEQRRTWFERGYRSGNVAQCDTFNVAQP